MPPSASAMCSLCGSFKTHSRLDCTDNPEKVVQDLEDPSTLSTGIDAADATETQQGY